MISLFKKRDLILEGIETFRQNSHKEKLYFGIYEPIGRGVELFYGEVIHSRDLERLTGKKVNYLNQWLFIFNFNRNDNEDIDNFYRFEGSKFHKNFTQISENRFFTDISPSLSSNKINIFIRQMISEVYDVSKNKTFLVTLGLLEQDELPQFYDLSEHKQNQSFVWSNLDF